MTLFSGGEDLAERDLQETILLISRLDVRDIRLIQGIKRALIKKGRKALPGLIRSLSSPNGMVRETCVEILGEISSPESTL